MKIPIRPPDHRRLILDTFTDPDLQPEVISAVLAQNALINEKYRNYPGTVTQPGGQVS